jgi:hypothetical protein
MEVLMLVRAKAAVSDKKRTAMTPMAHRDMMAPNVVAYIDKKKSKKRVWLRILGCSMAG